MKNKNTTLSEQIQNLISNFRETQNRYPSTKIQDYSLSWLGTGTSIYYYHSADTTACGLLVLESTIRPIVGISTLTLYIRYTCIYYLNLQFLNNVIITKTPPGIGYLETSIKMSESRPWLCTCTTMYLWGSQHLLLPTKNKTCTFTSI